MDKKIGLIGAGGHAKVIIELVQSMHKEVVAVVDDFSEKTSILNIQVEKFKDIVHHDEYSWIIAIGNNITREKVAKQYENILNFTTAIGNTACISPSAIFEIGTVVMQGATINAATKIGKHCIINTNASIDHDCIIDDFVHISPNVALAGNVSVGKGTHIGIGSSVIQGVNIGENVVIGAGSVIINDIPDNVTVVGVPGKIIKQH